MKTAFISKLSAFACLVSMTAVSCQNENEQIPVASVALDKTELILDEGTSETLNAVITPENATDKELIWSSADIQIATVSQDGKVTAVSAGETKIVVTSKSNSSAGAECTVTVNEVVEIIKVESITLDKDNISLYVGDSETLTATVKPDNATDKTVTWTSDNESIATVDNQAR